MGKYPWSGKRALEHCGLITKMGAKPRQHGGKCDGFQKDANNDEPCNICMKCRLNTFYEEQGGFVRNEEKRRASNKVQRMRTDNK